MKRCPNCGRAYSDMVTVCPNCQISLSSGAVGASQKNTIPAAPTVQQPAAHPAPNPAPNPVQAPAPQSTSQDTEKGNILWAVPGLLFPFVGLILWLCWRSKKPANARIAANGAAIGMLLSIVLRFI